MKFQRQRNAIEVALLRLCNFTFSLSRQRALPSNLNPFAPLPLEPSHFRPRNFALLLFALKAKVQRSRLPHWNAVAFVKRFFLEYRQLKACYIIRQELSQVCFIRLMPRWNVQYSIWIQNWDDQLDIRLFVVFIHSQIHTQSKPRISRKWIFFF